LDPATINVPYHCHIDIRDTVDYKKVMETYRLGPNGAILTALNLFTTKFDQVLDMVDRRSNRVDSVSDMAESVSESVSDTVSMLNDHLKPSKSKAKSKTKSLDYILLDTPGQIEIFTWSASGAIITDTISSTYPTTLLYVIDTPRSVSPTTFMSNMLYACSILYKTKLPFVLCFNKTDVVSHDFCLEWMQDFEAFQFALEDDNYMSTLIHSMCMVLEEFYSHLKAVGVSAATGEGMEDLFQAVDQAVVEYHSEYKPHIQSELLKKKTLDEEKKKLSLEKFVEDMSLSRS